MKIDKVFKKYSGIESELLLSFVLKRPKEFLYTNPDYQIPKIKYQEFTKLAKRREKGEPVAYLLGYKDFYNLRFKVTKDTLIPRPETEWLVEQILSLCHSRPDRESITKKAGFRIALRGFRNDSRVNILDIGTGSGCIAISIKKTCPKANITASDISEKALNIAKINAKTHKVKIDFIKSNLFAKLKNKQFDFIITNLPYVPLKDYKKFFPGLKFEPKLALTDNTNKFVLYKKFFAQVNKHLSERGKIYLETDPDSKPYLTKYAKQYLPKHKIKFYQDLNKLVRYAIIEK